MASEADLADKFSFQGSTNAGVMLYLCNECGACVPQSHRSRHLGWHQALNKRLDAIGQLAANADSTASMLRPLGGSTPHQTSPVVPIEPRQLRSVKPQPRYAPGGPVKSRATVVLPGIYAPGTK